MTENAVAQQMVDAAYRVHTTLGPGLLESVYQAALACELEKRALRVTRQQSIPSSMRRFTSIPVSMPT
jgi:GxxExxY protein